MTDSRRPPRAAATGSCPKERYTTREFLDLELDRLWSRVWQIACREEELAERRRLRRVRHRRRVDRDRARDAAGDLHAFHNACLHRGTRLADGCGASRDGTIRCPYHAWRYALDGRLRRGPRPRRLRGPARRPRLWRACAVDTWGGFVFVNLDPDAEPLLEFLDPLPALLAPYHLEQMRLRATAHTIIAANWKAVVDAFNEGYHVQGLHPQILPWTDDVSIEYEQLGKHAHYGRLPGARRELRPSPRLGLRPTTTTRARSSPVSWPGSAARSSARSATRSRSCARPVRRRARRARRVPGAPARAARRARLRRLGLRADLMTSADDVFWFPNIVGPIYPGSAILFRVRPNGRDPDRRSRTPGCSSGAARVTINRRCPSDSSPTGTTATGARSPSRTTRTSPTCSAGCGRPVAAGLRLNPRQESNVLHMHRVIDRYLTESEAGRG